jgi:hypothetical protein
MILLLGVRMTVTLTYLFSLVLFPFHLSSCEQRERNEGAHSPLIREGLETKYGNTYGRFWRDHKGIMACMVWVFCFIASLMYLFYKTRMLDAVIMILD